MSVDASISKTIRRTGVIIMDKCDVALPETCKIAEKGPVEPYLIIEDSLQVHVCRQCFNQMILSGQWGEKA